MITKHTIHLKIQHVQNAKTQSKKVLYIVSSIFSHTFCTHAFTPALNMQFIKSLQLRWCEHVKRMQNQIMPKPIATSRNEATQKREIPCKRWREKVEYNWNRNRQAMVRVHRELRNIALEGRVHKTFALGRKRRRRRRRMKNNCRKNISGCLNCHLDRIFCNDHFNLKTRACALACIPHFSWKGQIFRRKSCAKRKRNLFSLPFFFFFASVPFSDMNKTNIFC